METMFTRPEHLSARLEHLGRDRYHLFIDGRWTYAYYDADMLMCAYREFERQGHACTVVCDGEIVFYCARRHASFAQGICENCGHDWSAHSAYIVRQEKMCVEALPDGYSLHYHYTAENSLWYVQAYRGDVFVAQYYGKRAEARCKQSITRRIKAERGELPMPASVHTPAGFVDDIGGDW